jgi:hypothetical protein
VSLEQRQPISQAATTSDVEWRWVITVSLLVLLLFSLPYLYGLWVDSQNADVHFMGFIYNPIDGATYLSKIQLGKEGYWRTFFRHSPLREETGAYLDLMYTSLGRLAQFSGLSNTAIFHITRMLMALLMCLMIYHFASVVWRRRTNRQLFFLWVLFGSGFGWLLVVFGVDGSPDLFIPEAFPLHSMLVNAHFPLAIAMLALTASIVIQAFRPGFTEGPTVRNGGLTLFLCSGVLALVAPHALIPFALGIGLVMGRRWLQTRQFSARELRWLMMVVLPATPVALYYLAEVQYNPTVAAWSAQNTTPSPAVWIYLLGLGIPGLIAIPSVYRAIRRFEPDGDQFMLMWLIAILISVYLPVSPQRRFSIGLMIPVVYFTVRTVDNYRGFLRRDRYRNRTLAVLVGLSAMSYVLLLMVGLYTVADIDDRRIFLEDSYIEAITWVAATQAETQHAVVLAAPTESLWIPGVAGLRVVYAHPYETINAERNKLAVEAWYRSSDADAAVCEAVPRQFNAVAVIVDSQPEPACVNALQLLNQFGDVAVYAP